MGDVTQLGPRVVKSRTKEVESKEKVSQLDKEILIKHFICNDDKNPINFPPPRQFVVLSPDGFNKLAYEINDEGEVYCSGTKAVENMLAWSMQHYFHGSELLEMNYQRLKPCVDFWLASTDPIEKPKLIAWKGEDCLAFRKLPFEIGHGNTPLFDELMSRISNSKALMIFIGSLLFEKADMQQYVWLHGEGNDGKGALCRFLEKVLGRLYSSQQVPQASDRFWTAHGVRDKRLVVFPDCNNSTWVSSGMFKALTGGDSIRMELKGGAVWTEKLIGKYMFLSNERPDLSSEKADKRRIIYCEAKSYQGKMNPKYESELWKEGGYFMSKCSQMYLEACPNHEVIDLVDNSAINDLIDSNEEFYEYFLNQKFDLISDEDCFPNDFQDCLKEEFKTRKQQSEFRMWLERKHKVVKRSVRSGSVIRQMYVGIKSKAAVAKSQRKVSEPF